MNNKSKKYFLYKIVNLTNQKFYIGVTSNIKIRWKKHLNIAKGDKVKFPHHFQLIHKAIKKYGENNFIFEIVKEFDIEDDCYEAEENFITYFKKNKIKTYNIAGGGKGTGSGENHPMYGKKLPKEWVDNIKKAKEITSKNPETKEKQRKNMIDRNWIGENHPMYGKHHSEETKKKISNKGKGKITSINTKIKISKALKGKTKSEETKKKISKSHKRINNIGSKNYNFGNKWTEQQKRNLSIKKTGIKNPNRTLTDKQVFEVLKLKDEKNKHKIISEKIGCTIETVKNIVLGKSYNDIYKKYKKSKT